jgi:DMSO/TMAO reductase YedYZ heme-binding membrane subunit
MRKINLILGYASLLSILIFRNSGLYTFFWPVARISLLIIVFSRPLADIFSQTKIWPYLRKIVSIRQGIWIVAGTFALAHGIWYFMSINFWLQELFSNVELRNPTNIIWSWIWAMLFMLLPLITSNIFSMKKLGRNRKKIQRFTYPAFILTAIHVGLAKWELVKFIIIILVYSIIYFIAYKKIKCPKLIK